VEPPRSGSRAWSRARRPKDFHLARTEVLPLAPVLIDATPRGAASSPASTCARSGSRWSSSRRRSRAADEVDPAVGLTDSPAIGAEVGPHAPLARVHARSADKADVAVRRLRAAYRLDEAPLFRPATR